MKEIKIKGETYQYKNHYGTSESLPITYFYQGTKIVTFKRYVFFGETLIEVRPKLVFSVGINIEDPKYTKTDIRTRLEREVELLNRIKEIERGEII